MGIHGVRDVKMRRFRFSNREAGTRAWQSRDCGASRGPGIMLSDSAQLGPHSMVSYYLID